MVNTETISVDEVERNCIQFNKDYDLSKNTHLTFKEQFAKIQESNKDVTASNFVERTGYDSNRFYRMKRGEATSMETFVAFCIVFDIGAQNTIQMLKSLGVAFNPTDKVHSAYCYLVSYCRGKSLNECNKILKKLEVDKFLGA